MTNADIAAAFDEIGDLLEFRGANPFRIRAYRNAARVIRDRPQSVAAVAAEGAAALQEIPGIGADLAEKIAALVDTGELAMLNELRGQVPASVLTLLRVPGLGPKKVAAIHRELGVATLAELKEACEAHRIRELKGFGAKTEESILAGLAHAQTAGDRMPWADADETVQALLAHLKGKGGIRQLAAAGSYRRGKETVGDLDILADSGTPGEAMDRFGAFDGVAEVIARGDTKMSVRLRGGFQVDLRVVPAESFGAALQYFTGSKDHNVILRGLARERGLKINEYGVYRGDERVAGTDESEVYGCLDLPTFPPELREGRREFEWAAAGTLPTLVELSDLVGDLHMHTTETDGSASLEEMIAGARSRGLSYIAITDHSKRVTMARGMDGERLLRQWEAIDRVNLTLKGFRVLKGVEVDILEKGGLDIEDEVLARADWVVASVHYGQNQPREVITRRIVEALENPHVSAIAHPTGRIINRRPSYEVDLMAVFETAQREGKLLELNANPARLDLDDVACAAAKEHGIRIVISTDAHSVDGLGVMRYGILQARRAGLTKDDVANTRPWNELKALIGRKNGAGKYAPRGHRDG
jgi:DNA polymerase (family 10)